MSEIVFLFQQDPDGGYTARAIGQDIFTEADSELQLSTAAQDAVRCHFGEGEDLPSIRLVPA